MHAWYSPCILAGRLLRCHPSELGTTLLQPPSSLSLGPSDVPVRDVLYPARACFGAYTPAWYSMPVSAGRLHPPCSERMPRRLLVCGPQCPRGRVCADRPVPRTAAPCTHRCHLPGSCCYTPIHRSTNGEGLCRYATPLTSAEYHAAEPDHRGGGFTVSNAADVSAAEEQPHMSLFMKRRLGLL